MNAQKTIGIIAITILCCIIPSCGGSSNSGSGLSGINLTPTSPTTTVGNSVQFTAMATYSNGTPNQDVTDTASWASSVTSVSTVSTGLATALSAGQSMISVTFVQGTSVVSESTDLTVNASSIQTLSGMAKVIVVNSSTTDLAMSMDGRGMGDLTHGNSLTMEVPSGVHRFVSPDGKHSFLLNLRGQWTYNFKVSSPSKVSLTENE